MRANSHSARIVSPSLGAAQTCTSPTAGTTRRRPCPGRRVGTSHMRQVGSRDEVRCPLVYGDFMGDFRGVSDRAYPAALNTSHAAMRHLMRHGGLWGGRRLRKLRFGPPGHGPMRYGPSIDPNVSKPARCRQRRSARAYWRITAERHVRTTAPPCTPGKDRGRSSDECAVEWFSVQRIHKHHRAACTFMDWITPACPSLAAAERPIRAVMGAALETVTRCHGRCLRSCRLIEQIQQ